MFILRIGQSVGIQAHITSYTARHSFATVLKRSGVNISYISEALGQTDVKTTASYLDSFESDEQMKITAKLTDW
ncbi:MAG: tyrosine-type recombinase/integrase [Bacteroidia bacterium]|nr:tyrosine-type recombinase/integrase [Bacteroidia bacterium]